MSLQKILIEMSQTNDNNKDNVLNIEECERLLQVETSEAKTN